MMTINPVPWTSKTTTGRAPSRPGLTPTRMTMAGICIRPGGHLVTNINHPTDRYLKDETIRIKQQFDEPVQVTGDVDLGIHMGQGDDYVRKSAVYKDGTGTDTLTFEYIVASGDYDPDGIVIPESDHGGTGSITAVDDGEAINTLYHGKDQDSNHKVYSEAYIKNVSVISSPGNWRLIPVRREHRGPAHLQRRNSGGR